MIIIKHRVNNSKVLSKLSKIYGVEIDLRSNDEKEIYLSHNPFQKGEKLENWLKKFNHKIIVLNVKEEGLENRILKIMQKRKVTNFFFHDQTFSTMLKTSKFTNVSLRLSEYEHVKKLDFLLKKIKWVWVDHFTKLELSKKHYKIIKKNGAKICLVSPELVCKKNYKQKIKKLKKTIKKNKYMIDAICTKNSKIWLNEQ